MMPQIAAPRNGHADKWRRHFCAKTPGVMQDERRASGPPDFGTLLRQHRLAAALSQQALAELAGMSRDGISALERGYRRTPQRETLAVLATALALHGEQRREFEAAARSGIPRHDADRSALPLAMTSFVGRDAELDEIATLVREHRLVTLTGTGGNGKTQTALRLGLSAAGDCAVCFVGLAPVDNEAVVAAIAAAVRAPEAHNRALLDALVTFLKAKQLLLILDNCEHVIAQAATVADAILAGCPRIRILATSREPLRTAGECTYRLASLSMPPPEAIHRLDSKHLASYGSLALFTDRARAVSHRFELTDRNARKVAELCRRLGGIPLASSWPPRGSTCSPLKRSPIASTNASGSSRAASASLSHANKPCAQRSNGATTYSLHKSSGSSKICRRLSAAARSKPPRRSRRAGRRGLRRRRPLALARG